MIWLPSPHLAEPLPSVGTASHNPTSSEEQQAICAHHGILRVQYNDGPTDIQFPSDRKPQSSMRTCRWGLTFNDDPNRCTLVRIGIIRPHCRYSVKTLVFRRSIDLGLRAPRRFCPAGVQDGVCGRGRRRKGPLQTRRWLRKLAVLPQSLHPQPTPATFLPVSGKRVPVPPVPDYITRVAMQVGI